MSSADHEGQVKFLVCCIKHSNSGKVDFGCVAEELSIVSKAAAAKRFERLLKSYGVTGLNNRTPKKEDGEPSGTPKQRGSTGKKRKLNTVDENAGDIDEPNIKGEVKSEIKSEVKVEDGGVVKNERGKDSISKLAPPFPSSITTHKRDGEDDDDEVFIVSAPERTRSVPMTRSNFHRLPPSPAAGAPALQTSGSGHANIASPQQMTLPQPPLPLAVPKFGSGVALPYGFSQGQVVWHNRQHHGGTFWPDINTSFPTEHKHGQHHH